MSNRNEETKTTSDDNDNNAIVAKQKIAYTGTQKKPHCWKDTAPLSLIAQCVRRVKNEHLFNFLGSILFESEIHDVFAHSYGAVAGIRHFRGECIDKAAKRVRLSLAALGTPGADAAYSAALLVCVHHQFEATYGIVKAQDILRSIACSALHCLDDADTAASGQLRALLGWDKEDELEHSVVQGFKARVLGVYEQETTIQLMRMQPIALYPAKASHGNQKYLQ